MTYYTKSCPHCKHKYQIHDSQKHRYGSPFRICERCKKGFIDTDFIEIGLLPPWKIRNPRIYPGSIIILLTGILPPFFLWVPGQAEDYIVFLFVVIFGIINVVSDLYSYKRRSEYILEELEKSKARLSNPEYVLALYEIGVEIPDDLYDSAKSLTSHNH